MSELLEGKKAIVTGASRGIGRGIAVKFAREGAKVGLNYHKSDDKAKTVLDEIKEHSKGILLKGSVSNYKDSENIIDEFTRKYGGLDILVNNAGIYKRKDLEKASLEDFELTMDVNVKGPFILSKLALPHLKNSDSGRIINLSSQLAFKGSTHGTSYVTSKAAIIGLTRALSKELAKDNITVNAIAPGTIDTDMLSGYTEEDKRRRAKSIPLGRLGEPEDVAKTALYLASDLASYVTGEIIGVNGGSAMH